MMNKNIYFRLKAVWNCLLGRPVIAFCELDELPKFHITENNKNTDVHIYDCLIYNLENKE